MKATVVRKASFNAAHRLFNPEWDEQKNRAIFDKCSYANYHGHNYKLLVKVTGEIDPETGYVVDLKQLKEIIEEEVIEPFDHKNLNLDTAEFKKLIPTAENIAAVIYDKMNRRLGEQYVIKIILHETENNSVEFPVE